MFKRTSVSTAAIIALGSALALGAQAQNAPVRIEVTGSRILSPNATSPSPLQVLSSEDIAASGATNIQELLLKNPTFGVPAISRTNSNFQTASVGVATVDLRDLGSSRTLVLVNGRRFVPGVPGDSAVDLNAIPTDFIERIELLTGGASSTYGSDAVAGVVNIILKRDFQGMVVDASIGQAEKGDDEKKKVSLTWGTTSADGRGNMMAHLGYSKQGAVYSKDRAGGERDSVSLGLLTGNKDDLFTISSPFFSSFAPQGRIFINPGLSSASRTFDANGNVISWSTNGPAGADGVGATGFNRQEYRTIAVPTERYLLATKGEYALNQNHSTFFEGTYASTRSTSRLEPFPLAVDDIYPTTGEVPAEFMVNGTMVRNPNVPDSIYNLLTKRNADGALVYGFTRRLAEIGSRGSTADRDTFRVVTGVKGVVAKDWDYQAYVGYGATKEAQTSGGQVNVASFRNALEAIPDADDIDGDGNRTEAICRDAIARDQGCQPLNLFGFNSISAGAANYVAAPGTLATRTTQTIVGASISGQPIRLPAGPLGVAAGLEYRDEYSISEFDALTQRGLNAGNAQPTTEGSFDVKELFAEVRVPLLKDMPMAKSLALSGAVRGGKYSTVGSTLSWNAGVEWAPTSDIKVRATQAQSTRAPNIGELFSPPQQTFPPGIQDPCEGVTATTPGATADACRADPSIQANMAANGGVFTLTQSDKQGISGFNGGNPKLQEEKGTSTTLGLVFTPRSIPMLSNFVFTADYFNIEIDDAIVGTPRQFILEQCYGGDKSFCQFVTRRAAPIGSNNGGTLSFIDSVQTNSGGLATEGVDLTASYSNKVGPGRLNARLAWTYLMDAYTIPLPGSAKDSFLGEIGSAGVPRNKGSLALGYNTGPWGVNTQFTYIGKAALDDQFLAGFCVDDNAPVCVPVPAGSIGVGAKLYTDMQVTYTMGKAQYYLGIDNLLGTKAPRIDGNLPGGVTGVPTASDVYDAIGRRYYVGVRVGF